MNTCTTPLSSLTILSTNMHTTFMSHAHTLPLRLCSSSVCKRNTVASLMAAGACDMKESCSCACFRDNSAWKGVQHAGSHSHVCPHAAHAHAIQPTARACSVLTASSCSRNCFAVALARSLASRSDRVSATQGVTHVKT